MDQLSVLVTDDSATFRQLLCMYLARVEKARGALITEACDGEDALGKLKAGAYSLLITDIKMPRMDGLELVRRVRAEPEFQQLPIIIISTKGEEEDVKRGLELGANGYLSKPLSVAGLKEAVGNFLCNR